MLEIVRTGTIGSRTVGLMKLGLRTWEREAGEGPSDTTYKRRT